MQRILSIILVLLIYTPLFSQAIIELDKPQSQGGIETACQSITLKPGFSFAASSTSGALVLNVNPSTCDPYGGQNASLSSSEIYIRTKTYTSEDGERYLDQIQYFDGLGRPKQSVQRGITPMAADLVSIQDYDGFGRESNSWLPAVVDGNKGAYIPHLRAKSYAMATYSSDSAYSRPTYENSPLNRVFEQYGPGKEWYSNKKASRSAFMANIAGNDTLNCIYYTIAVNTSDTLVTINRVKNYDTAQLYVTRGEDEDGNASFEFKDKLGQLVLTRQIVRNGASKVLYDTYYIYDDFGNLTAVLPPLAADAMKAGSSWNGKTSDIIRNYAYLYIYDVRNRCIAKKLPGTDWILYVYDRADRLIFSQDGEQRKKDKKQWAFSIPDRLGRMVVSGICTHNLDYTTNPLATSIPEAYWVNSENTSYKGYNVINVGVYMSMKELHTVNYYDNYDFLGLNGIPNNSDSQYTSKTGYGSWYGTDYSAANKYKNKGLLTGTMTAQMNPDGTVSSTYLYSVMYYDDRGRLIQTKSTNHLGGTEEEYFSYNFTGQPTKQLHIHTPASTSEKQEELYAYTYDHAGRLIETKHKLNTQPEVILAYNEYDELGRLKTSTKNGQANLKTSYNYNIRSWTKSITGSLFTQNLYYNDVVKAHTYDDYKPSYSGNISGMEWKIQQDDIRSYRFHYDDLSRLIHAAYHSVNSVDYYNSYYNYDKHGNIKELARHMKDITTGKRKTVDILSMTYTGNQLINVKDTGTDLPIQESMDFKDHANGNGLYKYNANGAMYADSHKGISNIEYNSLNLPQSIAIDNSQVNGKIEYLYSATGQKLRTIHRNDPVLQYAPLGGTTTFAANQTTVETTDYAGNKIYKDNKLSRILVDGGYYDAEKKQYFFYLTDHLGNNRVVADQNGKVVQTTHYYPFGMAYAESTNQGEQPYKYNGKELDRMHGLNLYDYSARYYEPAIGRFTTVDPRAESYPWNSPYMYAGNNPILNIDPDGEDYWSTNDPELIQQFFNSMGRGAKYYDFTGWEHATDAEFVGNGTYNDETGKFHTSYASYKNGVATVTGVSFDSNFKPVSLTGQGYAGAFVYGYGSRGGGLYRAGYNSAQFGELSAFAAEFISPFDPNSYFDGVNNWNVDASGRLTGVNSVQQAKKGGGGKALAKIFIKGFGMVNKKTFHTVIKKSILNVVGKGNFSKTVGTNPDITVINGKIVLQGSKDSPFKGKTFNTDLNANDFLQ